MVDRFAWYFEWCVKGVLRYEGDGVVGRSRGDTFDEDTLVGIDDINSTPLEEDVIERHRLTGYHIAAVVAWFHAVAGDRDDEVSFNAGDKEAVALGLIDRHFASEYASHGFEWYQGDAVIHDVSRSSHNRLAGIHHRTLASY